jgi:hypothetical protein
VGQLQSQCARETTNPVLITTTSFYKPSFILFFFFLTSICSLTSTRARNHRYFFEQVNEFTIDYTNCDTDAPQVPADGDTNNGFQNLPSDKYGYHFANSNAPVPMPPSWLFINNQ